jgi:hypothetical protein
VAENLLGITSASQNLFFWSANVLADLLVPSEHKQEGESGQIEVPNPPSFSLEWIKVGHGLVSGATVYGTWSMRTGSESGGGLWCEQT